MVMFLFCSLQAANECLHHIKQLVSETVYPFLSVNLSLIFIAHESIPGWLYLCVQVSIILLHLHLLDLADFIIHSDLLKSFVAFIKTTVSSSQNK